MSYKNTHSAFACALAALLLPVGALAATLNAKDSVAGLGTDIAVTGAETEATLVVLPPYGSEVVRDIAAGDSTVRLTGDETQEAGLYTITVESADGVLGETQFNVLPDTVDLASSTIQTEVDAVAPGEAVHASVILRDRYGNTIPNRPVRLISSRSSDRVEALTQQTDARGQQDFIVTTMGNGTMVLRAVDLLSGNPLDAEASVTVGSSTGWYGGPTTVAMNAPVYQPTYQPTYQQYPQYQPVAQQSRMLGSVAGRALYGQVSGFSTIAGFVLEVPREMRVNVDENLTITAIDRDGRVVEDYTGTVQLASTDPNAILPSFGEITFRGSDLGRKTLVLGLRFSSAGDQLLYAQDSQNPSVTGEATIRVTGDVPSQVQQTITVTSPEQDSMVNDTSIVVEGTAAPFLNLIVTGGLEDSYGETDSTGKFSIPVNLNTEQIDHTLRVRDDSGRNDSGNIRVRLDREAPQVLKFTYTPTSPIEDEDVLVVVEAKDDGRGVGDVILTIDEDTYPLTPVRSSSGTYQLLFSFEEAGSYQPTLTVKDTAGNAREIVSSIEVRKKGMPKVENVRAEAKPSAVFLEWDALEIEDDPIDGYRIYVGESPTTFDHTLETDPLTTAATIAGLKPGRDYYFAVTATRGEMESPRSDVAQTTVLGLSLNVTPGNSSLTVEWTSLQEDIPLSQYLLEYGVEEGQYLEKRTLNGDVSTYTLRDLLNGINYHLQLTPITTTGDTLTDLAARGQGAPGSSLAGFVPGPSDPIPAGLGANMPSDPTPPIVTHGGAPSQPITGIPHLALWVTLAGVLGLGWYVRQRRKSVRATEAFLLQMQQQYAGGIGNTPR
jgi:hypothetical protein